MQTRSSHTLVSLIFLFTTLFLIEGCKLGYNKTPKRTSTTIDPPNCAQAPANANIDANATTVFALLSNLTCNALTASNDGYLMGQSLGNGNQIAQNEHANSYESLITTFADETGKTPAMISIDYEYDQLYTEEELIQANNILENHWNKGGFVTVSWTPLSPWVNDFSDITGTRGSHDDTLYSDTVSLADLIDPASEIHTVWRAKLDAIAVALEDLQDRDDSVTVLFRPLPQMNTNTYWWGLQAMVNDLDEDDAGLYKSLWEDMYDYLTDEKNLNNLLWVYNPGESVDLPSDSTEDNTTSVTWAYPGDDVVDVVAGIAVNDQLNIKDYAELKDMNKPLGMANYSPKSSADGSFDNVTYADRLDGSYNFISYWVTWHSSNSAQRALIDNANAEDLVERSYIFNAEDNKRGN